MKNKEKKNKMSSTPGDTKLFSKDHMGTLSQQGMQRSESPPSTPTTRQQQLQKIRVHTPISVPSTCLDFSYFDLASGQLAELSY